MPLTIRSVARQTLARANMPSISIHGHEKEMTCKKYSGHFIHSVDHLVSFRLNLSANFSVQDNIAKRMSIKYHSIAIHKAPQKARFARCADVHLLHMLPQPMHYIPL
ncbi:hypothetical protein T4B_4927 [Trichinella pseudospiralis]|uniref:Uncharacterized protein n=1 Tax=Trichinella pseudospiralis TaxID=6337 RepID=A0A0V1JAC9_TRIPS|nr:hypothetical protein T4B_4927 [Trichinella pseudospiralis]